MSALGGAVEMTDLVARIYDAALDREAWPGVLEAVCDSCSMQCAGLGVVDLLVPELEMVCQWGYDPQVYQDYTEVYARENPLMAAAHHLPVGQISRLDDVMARETYRNTRFYREWAEPAGFADVLHAWLDKSAAGGASFVLVRHIDGGVITQAQVERFALLLPHLRRAVVIGRVIEHHKSRIGQLSDLLDALSTPAFLVARGGRIVETNRAGDELIASRDGVSAPSRVLKFTDGEMQRQLSAALHAAGEGRVTSDGQLLSIDRERAGPLAVSVLPLRPGRGDHAAIAAVFARNIDFDAEKAVAAMAQFYGLTAGERKVVRAIADGLGVASAASRLGISQATARTHLAHVFQKTGAKRQAEIIRMLGGYGGPIG